MLRICIIYLLLISFDIFSITLHYLVKCILNQIKKSKEIKNFNMKIYRKNLYNLNMHLFKLIKIYYIILFVYFALNLESDKIIVLKKIIVFINIIKYFSNI